MSDGKASTLLAAETLMAECHACRIDDEIFLFDSDAGTWHGGLKAVERAAIAVDGSLKSDGRKEVYKTLQVIAPEAELAPANYIAFANGVVDIDDADAGAKPGSPDLVMANVIPWDFDPDAASDAVEAFLDGFSAGDPLTRANVEEMLGCCLYRSCEDINVFFVLIGSASEDGRRASNGKTALLKVCGAMLGRQNCTSINVKNLGREFMRAQLRGKLAALCDETSLARVSDDAVETLKRSATGDTIFSDVKYLDPVEFTNTATVILSSNDIVKMRVDDGIADRIKAIPCDAHFKRKGPGRGKGIHSKLANQADMAALIVIAVRGLQRVLDSGFTPNEKSEKLLEKILLASDTVLQWEQANGITPESLHLKGRASTYSQYDVFCRESNIDPISRSEFYEELSAKHAGRLWADKRRGANGEAATMRWVSTDELQTKD